ncbi:MAG: hypothetical protein UGF89_02495 [Acutalibacteraceae bacterium]|nr:hypothetical protein [Acutalibacteraceae bacterium]
MANQKKRKYDERGVPTPLTVEDILIGLECCSKGEDGCVNCPFLGIPTPDCANILTEKSAKLIRKFQRENKRLKKENDSLNAKIFETEAF